MKCTALPRCALPMFAVAMLAGCGPSPAPEQPAPVASASVAATRSAPGPAASAPQPVKSKVAVYEGTRPCADCSGVETQLLLQRDELGHNSYVLRQTYIGRSTQAFMSAGRWTMSVANGSSGTNGHVALIHLDSGRPADRRTWRVENDRSLTLVAGSGKPPASGINFTIKRTGGDLDLHTMYERALARANAAP